MMKFLRIFCVVLVAICIFNGCAKVDSQNITRSGVLVQQLEKSIDENVFNAIIMDESFKFETTKCDDGYEFHGELPTKLLEFAWSDDDVFVIKGKTDKKKNVIIIEIYQEHASVDLLGEVTDDSINNKSAGEQKVGILLMINFLEACKSVCEECSSLSASRPNIKPFDFVVSTFDNEQIVGEWAYLLKTQGESGLVFTATWQANNA